MLAQVSAELSLNYAAIDCTDTLSTLSLWLLSLPLPMHTAKLPALIAGGHYYVLLIFFRMAFHLLIACEAQVYPWGVTNNIGNGSVPLRCARKIVGRHK